MAAWRRIVYEDQGYSLNYISADFLKGLNENGYNEYKIRDLSSTMLYVVDHISVMILIAHVYLFMKNGSISFAYIVFGICLFMLMLLSLNILTKAPILKYIRMMAIIYFVIHVGLLSKLISIVNIFTQDYHLKHVENEHMREVDVIPMNCLFLALIILASRFDSSRTASMYLQFALATFSMLPLIKRYIMESKNNLLIYGFTATIVAITCYTLKGVLVRLYIIGIIIILLVMPLIYIHSQKYKSNVEIEFPSIEFCKVLLNVLESERSIHDKESVVEYKADGSILSVALNIKTLRIKVNALYETCYLISTLLEEFMK